MFFRMLLRAAVIRRGRAFTAVLAMIVAATVATATLNLFVDVQSKLEKEFRNYGANVVVVGNGDGALPTDVLGKTKAALTEPSIVVPFAYAVARTRNDQPVVVSGTDLAAARELNKWWSVTHWPQTPGEALLGSRAAVALNPQGEPFDLIFQRRTLRLRSAGILRTGAAEDSRIYISLSDFEKWTGLRASAIEIAISGSTKKVVAEMARLKVALPDEQVRPVRQIQEGEGLVLGKTRATLLAACILIISTAALCVLATLSGWVLDRRRDFAIMKALGASQKFIGAFFAAEAAFLGIVGSVIGFFLGIGIAAWIGRTNFQAAVVPRFELYPIVLVGCVMIALIAAVVPISVLRSVQPAMILKGE